MSIIRKPQTPNVNDIINKGSSVKKLPTVKDCLTVNITIPINFINNIEQILGNKIVKMPRTRWILEAIAEKIEKEKV